MSKELESWNHVKQEWVGTQSSAPSKQIAFHKGFNEYDTDQDLAGHNLRANGGRGKNCSMASKMTQ